MKTLSQHRQVLEVEGELVFVERRVEGLGADLRDGRVESSPSPDEVGGFSFDFECIRDGDSRRRGVRDSARRCWRGPGAARWAPPTHRSCRSPGRGRSAARRGPGTCGTRRVDAHVIATTAPSTQLEVQTPSPHRLHAQKNSKLSRSSFLLSAVHRTQGTPIYEKASVSPAGMCRIDVTSMLPSG